MNNSFYNTKTTNNRTNKFRYSIKNTSSWSIVATLGALLLPFGGVMYMHGYWPADLVVSFGMSLLFYSMFMLCKDDIRIKELRFQGDHTGAVEMRRRYGLILSLAAVIICFLAFFWAFFHSSFAPTVEIKDLCNLKVLNFSAEWTAADYALFITLLATALLCGMGYLVKKNIKSSKTCEIIASVTFIVGLLCFFTLFCLEPAHQKEIYKDIIAVLELSVTNKVSLVVILLSLLVGYYLFKMVRNWVITTFSITMYYLLVIGARTVLLWYAVDPDIFLSVEGGLILFSVVWVLRKPEPILEWGKQLVEVVFFLQLTLVIVRLLAVVFSQPTPSLWVYTSFLFLLFEAAVCLGKILVEMAPAEGILWGDFTARVEKFRTLVYPDYAPAFQGGEESAQEPETQVPNPNVVAMMQAPAGPVQGGLPYGGGGPLPGGLAPVPLSGRLPDCIVEERENGQVVIVPEHLCPHPPFEFPPKTVPNTYFPAGGFFNNPSEEVPNTCNGRSLFPVDALRKTRILRQMPYGKIHLELTSTFNNEDPGRTIHLENATRTRSSVYLEKEFNSQIGLPIYGWNGGHLELVQGREYSWTPLNIAELVQHLRSKRLTVFEDQLVLRRNPLRFIWYGELRFKLASHPFQMHPAVTGFFLNGSKYCLESEQPPRNAFQYVGAIIKTIRERDYNASFSITRTARDEILSEISRRIESPAGPAAPQGQVVDVEPQPHQEAAGVGGDGQCDQSTLVAPRQEQR